MPGDVQPSQSASRNDDPAHIALVAAITEKRGCDWPGKPCGRDIPEFGGRDAACDCEIIATEREGFRSAMGEGGPCMSCGGNDGYGPAPHHIPDCYFAGQEDVQSVGCEACGRLYAAPEPNEKPCEACRDA